MYYDVRNKKLIIILISTVFVLTLMLVVGYFFLTQYEVTTVNVSGNEHYSAEEIKDIVTSGRFGNNTLVLGFKYRNKSVDDIPFVETMDVDIVSAHEINITVYEKAIAGYVNYLDRFMYFDKDGIVVESSTNQIMDLPYVTGLSFDHCVMHEKLPVENEKIFSYILMITQLLTKYNVTVDRINFDSGLNLTLYKDKAVIELGQMDNIDEKMIRLSNIMPKLQGLSGTLDMKEYSEETDEDFITFKRE